MHQRRRLQQDRVDQNKGDDQQLNFVGGRTSCFGIRVEDFLTKPHDPKHRKNTKLELELSKSETRSDVRKNEAVRGDGCEVSSSFGGREFGWSGEKTYTRGTTRTRVKTVRKMMKARTPPTTEGGKKGGRGETKVRRRVGKREVRCA